MPKTSKRTASEHAIIAAKAALTLVAGGGVLKTLLDNYIPSTWQSRQEKVLSQLSEDMKRLEGRLNDQRLRSEDFHITMVKVIRDSIVELHTAKQEAFRAILLNEAMAPTGDRERDLFIKITEDLTGDHIRLLKVLSDAKKFCDSNQNVRNTVNALMSPNRMEPSSIDLQSAVGQAMSGIPSDHFAVLLGDLQRYGLILEGDVINLETFSGGFVKRTKPLGDRYIKFITLP